MFGNILIASWPFLIFFLYIFLVAKGGLSGDLDGGPE